MGGYRIPKGTMVVPLQWAIHMNPKTFPKPEEYDPSRFLEDGTNFTKPESFIPFQIGKENKIKTNYFTKSNGLSLKDVPVVTMTY